MYLPPFILFLTSSWLVLRIKNGMITRREWKVVFILLLGVIFAYALVMPYHMYMSLICAMILFSFLLSEYADIHKRIGRFRGSQMNNQSFNIIITCLSVLFIMGFPAYSMHMCFEEINDTVPLNMPKASGMYLATSESDLIETVDYVRETVPSNEKILVGSYIQDKNGGE